MVYLSVTMIIKEGKMDDFLTECRRIRPLVLAENGCHMYDFTRETDIGSTRQEPMNPNRITLYEKWASPAALDAHSKSPHMIEYGSRVADMREQVIIRAGTAAF